MMHPIRNALRISNSRETARDMKLSTPTAVHAVGLTMLVCCVGMVTGCTTAPAVERGYPAAWPGYVALRPGGTEFGTELNGTYANDGVVVIPEVGEKPITLASLIPPLADGRPQPNAAAFAEAKEITLRVVNHQREGYSSINWPAIEFIADSKDGKEGVWVEAMHSDRAGGKALTYTLSGNGVLHGVPLIHYRIVDHDVLLTKAADGSLIAEIQNTGVGMSLFFVPYFSQSRIWARFSPRPAGAHRAAPGNSSAAAARNP